MRTIRFWTSHNCRNGESWRTRLYLQEEFRFVFDETDPEYLLVSEHLYADAARMRRFFELNDGSRIVVWHNGEAVFPDMNLFDYAYVFDREAALGDRICRIPIDAYFDVDERFGARETVDPDEELKRKTGFCSFIYGNPYAHPRRDQLFHLLNGYKRVDALGPHLNNCGNRPSRTDGDWHKKLVAEKRPYKFSIASENATYSGYVSEKLTSSFRAHTVPIYWGDPTVAAEYNPEAFINANGMTDEEVLAAVKRVDEDDALWKRMVAAPYKTAEQLARVSVDFGRVKAFSLRVFDGRSAAEKRRAPSGYWNGIYRAAVRGAETERAFQEVARMKWFLKRKIRHLKRKLVERGLTEREARAYLDAIYRFRDNPGHLDFENPKTFCEKLNWLKLYWYNPLVGRCSDKVGVREYVSEKLGPSFLVPLIATYDRAEDVDFGALPDKFAMKVSWGSGQNIICADKSKLDVEGARGRLAYWMRRENNHYFDGLEWGYRDIVPKIVVEEFLEDAGDLPDYKVYCYGGEPTVTAVIRDRGTDRFNAMFFDNDYRKLRPLMMRGRVRFTETDFPRPEFWDRMLDAARVLAAPFPHVRVDFYVPADGVLRVGEMTFWSANGLTPHEPPEWDRKLGDMLKLPPKGEYRWGRSK